MSRVSPFEAFLAGAYCFVAGLSVASGLDSSRGWIGSDLRALAFGVIFLAAGFWSVRRLYIRQQGVGSQAAP